MKQAKITKGSSVYFDIGRGTQSGTVIDLMPDISNGRLHASIELDQPVPGLATVPVDQLSITKDVTNFVFLSGDPTPMALNSTDRRFWVNLSSNTTSPLQPTSEVAA
jgi:hypothetical protein